MAGQTGRQTDKALNGPVNLTKSLFRKPAASVNIDTLAYALVLKNWQA